MRQKSHPVSSDILHISYVSLHVHILILQLRSFHTSDIYNIYNIYRYHDVRCSDVHLMSVFCFLLLKAHYSNMTTCSDTCLRLYLHITDDHQSEISCSQFYKAPHYCHNINIQVFVQKYNDIRFMNIFKRDFKMSL